MNNNYNIYQKYKHDEFLLSKIPEWYNKQIENIIVSGYYEIENKRPSSHFKEWIKNFFYLKSPKVIFTCKKTFTNVFENLYNFNCIQTNLFYFNSKINSLFVIQELEDTFIWKNYKNLMEMSVKLDKEIHNGVNHNKYLYTIWNNKSFWIKQATSLIPADSYYWTDIGCIRTISTPEIQNFISSLNFVKRNDKKILLGCIENFKIIDNQTVDSIPYIYYNNGNVIRIQGGFFGGGKKEIIEWCNLYIQELNLFQKFKIFSGKDQYIMGSIYLRYKNKFELFFPSLYIFDNHICHDNWFKFIHIYS